MRNALAKSRKAASTHRMMSLTKKASCVSHKILCIECHAGWSRKWATGGRNLTVRVNMFHRKLCERDMGAIIVTQ